MAETQVHYGPSSRTLERDARRIHDDKPVSPGSIASEALVGWAASVGVDGNDPYALMAAIDEHFGHPAHLPRAGLPDEIGPVVAFLASKRNSYMTGATINVDGGSDFT